MSSRPGAPAPPQAEEQLDVREVAGALEVLERARRENQLSRRERLALRWQPALAYTAVALVLSILLLIAADAWWWQFDPRWSDRVDTLGTVLSLVLLIALMASAVLTLLNLRLVARILRQIRLAKRLGFRHALRDATPRRGLRRVAVWAPWLAAFMGVLLMVGSSFSLPFLLFSFDWMLLFLSVVFFLGGATIVFAPVASILRRRFECLDEALSLEKVLRAPLADGRTTEPDEPLHLQPEVVRRLAVFEQTQIDRQRARALEATLDAPSDAFRLLKSQSAVESELRLPGLARLRLAEALETLVEEAEPPGEGAGRARGTRCMRLGEASVEISYTVEPVARVVRLDDVRVLSEERAQGLEPR